MAAENTPSIEENKRRLQARKSKTHIIYGYIEMAKNIGSDKVTVTGLCRQLGISVGRFYHYFRSIEDLEHSIYYVLDDQISEWNIEQPGSGARENLIRYTVWFARHNLSLGVSLVKRLFSGSNTNLAVPKKETAYIEAFSEAFWHEYKLEDVYSLDELIRHIRVVSRGVILDWAVHDGSFDLEQAMCAAVSSAVDGILALSEGKRLYYDGCGRI